MSTLKQDDLPDYTFEDYQIWEGDWELIQGIPYAMTPSSVKNHQLLVSTPIVELNRPDLTLLEKSTASIGNILKEFLM